MSNSQSMRQSARKCINGGVDGLVESFADEVLARGWLDADVPVGVLVFQLFAQLRIIN